MLRLFIGIVLAAAVVAAGGWWLFADRGRIVGSPREIPAVAGQYFDSQSAGLPKSAQNIELKRDERAQQERIEAARVSREAEALRQSQADRARAETRDERTEAQEAKARLDEEGRARLAAAMRQRAETMRRMLEEENQRAALPSPPDAGTRLGRGSPESGLALGAGKATQGRSPSGSQAGGGSTSAGAVGGSSGSSSATAAGSSAAGAGGFGQGAGAQPGSGAGQMAISQLSVASNQSIAVSPPSSPNASMVLASPSPPPPPAAAAQPPAPYAPASAAAPTKPGPAMPEFPWPPPGASAWVVIPDELIARRAQPRPSFGVVSDRLARALDAAGYSQRSFLSVPNGFAVVTQLERIGNDGTPTSARRWFTAGSVEIFSLEEYLRRLLFAEVGRYRLVVLVITDVSISASGPFITAGQAAEMADKGFMDLPPTVAQMEYSANHRSTALIYEFRKRRTGDPEFVKPSPLPGRDHLVKARIWAAIENILRTR
jgi:hypothetical protein